MKNVFAVSLLILILSSFSWAKEGDKTVIGGGPCYVSISLIGAPIKEKLVFWGKVVDSKESDGLPAGRELVFEPKTTHFGPKMKQVKILLKRGRCWLDVEKDDYFTVSLDDKGEGTLYAVVSSDRKERKKSLKYPVFQPWFNACVGFQSRLGFTSADLFALGTVAEMEEDQKENVRVITFKTKKVWNGPEISTFKVIDEIKGTCPKRFEVGKSYDLILNSANDKYYYQDCCGFMLGPVGKDFEVRFSADRAAQKKKLLGK